LFSNESATNATIIDTFSNIENVTGTNLIDYIVGSSVANTITGGAGADVLTGGLGADTFSLTAVATAADRDVITDFSEASDIVGLDVDYTTIATAAAGAVAFESFAVTPVVGGTFSVTALAALTSAIDVVEFTGGNTTTADLSAATDGSELFKLLGTAGNAAASITTDANGNSFYIVAYDAGNAYLYKATGDAGDATIESDDIALVGTFNTITADAFTATNFSLVA
jgi:hypothetical protein